MWKYHPMPRALQIEGLYTAFHKHFPADHFFRGETHNFAELVLVRAGRIGVTAGLDSFILEAGTAILHPAMEFHSLRAEGGTEPEIYIFTFHTSRMPTLENRVFALNEESFERAERILTLLERSTERQEGSMHAGDILPGGECTAQCALLELELLLLTLSERQERIPAGDTSTGLLNWRRALAVMSENLTKPLNTAELAALCRISPSLLKKLFSHYAGIGVMEYFRAQKMHAAIPFLRMGQSVREVAEHFGFADPGYFSTAFRRVTGKTPGYYRTH